MKMSKRFEVITKTKKQGRVMVTYYCAIDKKGVVVTDHKKIDKGIGKYPFYMEVQQAKTPKRRTVK